MQLAVMHTVPGVEAAAAVRSPARWKVPEYRSHLLEDARRNMEAILSDAPAGVNTRVQVVTGSAAHTILEHAADVNADRVVVGRSRGFKLLGSRALRVLRTNDRALLVTPSAAAHRTGRVERQRAA
jgi:nucleotide-binding universal stress UspA family protein